MAIRIEPARAKTDCIGVAKDVVSAAGYLAVNKPEGALRHLLDALVRLRPQKGTSSNARAWFLWQEALAGTIVQVLPGDPWNMGRQQLAQMTTDLLWASAERMKTSPIMLYRHHLERPASFLPFKAARRDIVLAVCSGPKADQAKELETSLIEAFKQAFAAATQADPNYFAGLIDEPTSEQAERERQWDEHRDSIGHQILVEPVFGQDRVTLRDLYVPPRCIFSETRKDGKTPDDTDDGPGIRDGHAARGLLARVQDLRETVLHWWHGSDRTDSIRLCAGAPGRRKPSFDRMPAG